MEELDSLVLINSEMDGMARSVVTAVGLAAKPKPQTGRKFRPTQANPRGTFVINQYSFHRGSSSEFRTLSV